MTDKIILKKPIITEKSTRLGELRKYVFMVSPRATKNEVREALRAIYRVDAVAVNVIQKPGKARRFRNIKSTLSGYKKAVVTLKEGQKIDVT